MIRLRRSDERGYAEHGWLETRHTFSFASYHDRAHMGFRALRVINEDRIAPGQGFGAHPHRDMEILTFVLEGELRHKDSLGNGSIIRPGEVQRMTAGTGVTHSEFNASRAHPVHLLQIWILPAKPGLEPSYEQKAFPGSERRGRLRLVASPDASEGSVLLHQDVRLYAGLFERGERAQLPLARSRGAWVQVARGTLALNGEELRAGDGAALEGEPAVEIEGRERSEVLVFDLA